jgi:predicted RecB family nuclease
MTKVFTPNLLLSKSRFLAGLQCPRRLWFQNHQQEPASPVTPAQQALFDSGYEVGRLATQKFPRGVLVEEDHFHHNEAVEKTKKLRTDSNVSSIFEAGFLFDDVRVRSDILERRKDGNWNLIEVKSSTKVKDYHLWDVAVQQYVLKGSGVDVRQSGIMCVNNQYVFQGREHDLAKLFMMNDLTSEASLLTREIPDRVKAFRKMLSQKSPPAIEPSRHCQKPYGCEFWQHCTREKPEHWIFKMHGIGQNRLEELIPAGIQDIPSIPSDFPLSLLQRRIQSCVVAGREYFDRELKNEFNKARFPIHFLDFETLGTAIPLYPQTRPYQTIPFQWSDHVLSQSGSLAHREYLCTEAKDPRKELTHTLLEALGTKGTIAIYTSYEAEVIRDLAENLPEYRDRLLATLPRMMDFHALIQQYYYHPKFYGSFSLKSVLPALIPEMTYGNLSIKDGNEASSMYLKMIDKSTDPDEKSKIRQALLTYCRYDTLALVKIREKLMNKG